MTDLKDANENPWYILMTLYGEQEGGRIDRESEKNRAVWNAWACQRLDQTELEKLKKEGVDVPALGAWVEMEQEVRRLLEIRAAWLAYEDLPDATSTVDLSKTTFSNTVAFNNLVFTARVLFMSTTFWEDANFRDAVFMQGATFTGTTFTKAAQFLRATFTRSATFFETKFEQNASFNGAKFLHDTTFDGTMFSERASFYSATFMQRPNFSCTFMKGANFGSATFTQDAYFSYATFTEGADFGSATIQGRAYFVRAAFGTLKDPVKGLLDLHDSQFEKPASFRDAKFINRYPDFTGAILHDKTLFPSERENWPGKTNQDPRNGRDSCAFLRHHIAKQGLPEAEHFFFRREMLPNHNKSSWPSAINSAGGASSVSLSGHALRYVACHFSES